MKKVFTILLMITILCGCVQRIDFGELENNVYRNDMFGLIYTIPSGWESSMPIKSLMGVTYERFMPAKEVQGTILLKLSRSKKMIGSDLKISHSISFTCLNLSRNPDLSNLQDYLDKKKAEKSRDADEEHTFEQDIEMIDKLEFTSLIIDNSSLYLGRQFDDLLLIISFRYSEKYRTHPELSEKELLLQIVKNMNFSEY